jgi:hypothetical protein
LLYAGTTSFSFKYSTFIVIVKKLKQWSISAGNITYFMSNGTSETLRNETVSAENIKAVSVVYQLI